MLSVFLPADDATRQGQHVCTLRFEGTALSADIEDCQDGQTSGHLETAGLCCLPPPTGETITPVLNASAPLPLPLLSIQIAIWITKPFSLHRYHSVMEFDRTE